VINAFDTGLAGDDLEAILCPDSAIVAPKVETPHDVEVLEALLTQGERQAGMAVGQVEIFPTLETARDLMRIKLRAAQRVCQPLCGPLAREVTPRARLCLEQGGSETLYIRSKVLLEARRWHDLPIDGELVQHYGSGGLRADARLTAIDSGQS
jgi:citrate lyase subunit beta/citryl-CoA lyase